MSYYNEEPKYEHGDPPKIGIILANLGTPREPKAPAVRKYLGQFLMDRFRDLFGAGSYISLF